MKMPPTHRALAHRLLVLGIVLALWACAPAVEYDLILRNGTIYDGTGAPAVVGDLAISGDRVSAVGDLGKAVGDEEIDVSGLAVAPGFINMLSWATESLIEDGRSQGDIRQGVTLEIFGEGQSMGPLSEEMKKRRKDSQGDLRFDIEWTTLGEYLEHLVERGVSPNVASYVGATTLRIHEIGYEDRPPSPDELDRMRNLVRQAMEEGALGVGSSLIYAPAFYASTEELTELVRVAGEYGGAYISHIRNEGNSILAAVDELIGIARDAGVPAEIYHLKAAGQGNWDQLDEVFAKVEAARAEGLRITADMYTYIAGSTGLDASMPPWVQEGGYDAWAERLADPDVRRRVGAEMLIDTEDWENMFFSTGAEGILLVGFRNQELKPLTGKTLAEVAAMRGKPAHETAMDLVIEDGSRVQCVYFTMSEDNVRKKIQVPWVSFGSDAGSMAPEGAFLRSSTHPRAYGNVARLLGRYVREEKLISLEEAIRKLTDLPATNLGIRDRGRLESGRFADVVVFDPATIIDHATFEEPHQYSTGVTHVWVNGTQVLRDGEHTGATPGRVVRGPGYQAPPSAP
ncbi:MAG: D-aminoacylase [Acidobacteriota bacterium]|nr:D-aminoacylase [Acidobacteriota bacterium]